MTTKKTDRILLSCDSMVHMVDNEGSAMYFIDGKSDSKLDEKLYTFLQNLRISKTFKMRLFKGKHKGKYKGRLVIPCKSSDNSKRIIGV